MKKKTLYIALALPLLAVGSMSGCATVFTGTTQTMHLESTPSGAKVKVNGVERGQTPTAIALKKGSSGQLLSLTLPGYEPKTFQPETTFNPVAILNLGSLPAWGIDAISGALWKYDPTFYHVDLRRSRH